MTADEAERMLAAAKTHARTMGKAVSIIVVDAGGASMAFARLDGAAPSTAVMADGKASSAAYMGRDSALIATAAQTNPMMVAVHSSKMAKFTPVQGAVVVRRGTEIVGAVGVSGATSEEDEQIARAGAAAL